jgi:hypothetical protein
MLAPSQQKDQKIKQIQKNEGKPFGPWPSLPSAVLISTCLQADRQMPDEKFRPDDLWKA